MSIPCSICAEISENGDIQRTACRYRKNLEAVNANKKVWKYWKQKRVWIISICS